MADPTIKDLAYRGLASVLGGPVDLATMVMRPFGYNVPEQKVVGGSEWIGKKMQDLGVVSTARNPLAEFAASMVIPTPTLPIKSASVGIEALLGLLGATAFHGSPYKFTKFDSSKIGTGEGAQAYGHGLYFAEAPEVAAEYRRKLSQDGGSIYKVDIPDEAVARMLNWDKPLSEQPKSVQKTVFADIDSAINKTKQALATASERRAPTTAAELERLQRERARLESLTGESYYNQLSLGVSSGAPNASEYLKQIGITGIRYLDELSRGTGQGTSNFVIFPGNENLLNIVERNGQKVGITGQNVKK